MSKDSTSLYARAKLSKGAERRSMILEEAIKYQEADKSGVVFNQQARQLGIEAMKRIQDARDIQPESACADLLPSETDEKEGK